MHIRQTKGLTLMELLLASILISIVIAGVVAISYAIKSMQDTTNRASVVAIRTTAAMSHMIKNISLAIGWQGDPGIRFVPQWDWEGGASPPADPDVISVREDINHTPEDYTDDTWFTYVRDTTDHTLVFCAQAANGNPDQGWDPRVSGQECDTTTGMILSNQIINCQFRLYIDTSQTDPQFHVAVILETRYDPSQASNPISNPETVLESKVNPAAHSW